MAVSVDTVTPTNGTGNVSFSHTCTGSDRLLLVGVSVEMDDAGHTVSGITYNGVALTQVSGLHYDTASARCELWALVAPSVGSHPLAITWTNPVAMQWAGAAISFTGVNQSTPLGTAATGVGFAGNAALSPTSTPDALVVGVIGLNGGTAATDNQTNQWNQLSPDTGQTRCLGSTKAGTASTTTIGWTHGTTIYAAIAVAVSSWSGMSVVADDGLSMADTLDAHSGVFVEALTLQEVTHIVSRRTQTGAVVMWWNPPPLAETLWAPRDDNCACGLGHVGPQGCNWNWQIPYAFCQDTTWYMQLPEVEDVGYANDRSLGDIRHACRHASNGQIAWCTASGTLGYHCEFGWIDFPYTPSPVTINYAFPNIGAATSGSFHFSLEPETEHVIGLAQYGEDPGPGGLPWHYYYTVRILRTETGWDWAGRTLTFLHSGRNNSANIGVATSANSQALAVWVRQGQGDPNYHGVAHYALSADGGVTWSAPAVVPGLSAWEQCRGGHLVETSTGAALLVQMFQASPPAVLLLTYDWTVGWSSPATVTTAQGHPTIGSAAPFFALAAPHGRGDLMRVGTVTQDARFRIWRTGAGIAPTMLDGPEAIPGGSYGEFTQQSQDLTYYSGSEGNRWLWASGHGVYPATNLVVSRRLDEADASWVSSADLGAHQVEFGMSCAAYEPCPNVMTVMGGNSPGAVWIAKVAQP